MARYTSAGARAPVRVLLREGSLVPELEPEIVRGDLRDPASVERAVAGCGLVFHVAADYRLCG